MDLREDAIDSLKHFIGRARESLKEGWRELLVRSTGALTHFGTDGGREIGSRQEFPHWSLLAAETWETALSVVIQVEIPGMRRDDLVIDVHGNALRIRGERHSSAAEGDRFHLMERAYGRFERTIPLPRGVDADNPEIAYRDGVLTVILQKTETA
jgi:HSP20 family protein